MTTKNIGTMAKRMEAEMKPHMFDPLDPITIIEHFCNFKLVYDTNEIHEVAAMWLFHFFMKTLVSSVLRSQLLSNQKARRIVTSKAKTAALINYPQVVDSLLRAYKTYENIASAEDEVSTFSQPSGKTQHNTQKS